MIAIVVSGDPDWPAPLSAMLRERGFEVIEALDLVDALASVRQGGVVAMVVNDDLGPADTAAVLRGVSRRFGDDVRRVGVGSSPSPEIAQLAHAWVAQPYRYVAVVAAVGPPPSVRLTAELVEAGPAAELQRIARHSGIVRAVPHTASGSQSVTGAFDQATPDAPAADAATPDAAPPVARATPTAPGSTTLSEIHRLLQLARFEPYEALLGVAPDADEERVRAAGDALLERVDDDRIPSHVADSAFAELAELRAAIEDAVDVLCSPQARDLVRAAADATPPVPSASPADGL